MKQLVHDYVIVSGKKVEGIQELISKIEQFGKKIVQSISILSLPMSVQTTAKAIQQHLLSPSSSSFTSASQQLILSVEEFVQLPTIQPLNYHNGNEDEVGIEESLLLLHNMGTLVYHQSTKMICLQPIVLIKMVASFIAKTEDHQRYLFGEKDESIPSDAIFPHSKLQPRVKKILQRYYKSSNSNNNSDNSNTLNNKISDDQVNRLITLMEKFGLYYSLNTAEQRLYLGKKDGNYNENNNNNDNSQKYYLFPSLRPSNGQFFLPTIQENHPNPHFTLAVRYTNSKKQQRKRYIPSYLFFELQVRTRKYHDKKNQIYGNGMKLNRDSTDAWILPNHPVSTVELHSFCIDFLSSFYISKICYWLIHSLHSPILDRIPFCSFLFYSILFYSILFYSFNLIQP